MSPLDGNDKITPTAFDAHEQLVRGEHVPTGPNSPDKRNVKEFPKAVDHVDHPSGVGQEPIIVKSAAEEKAYNEAKADEAEQK
jgi:hypothetical protein